MAALLSGILFMGAAIVGYIKAPDLQVGDIMSLSGLILFFLFWGLAIVVVFLVGVQAREEEAKEEGKELKLSLFILNIVFVCLVIISMVCIGITLSSIYVFTVAGVAEGGIDILGIILLLFGAIITILTVSFLSYYLFFYWC